LVVSRRRTERDRSDESSRTDRPARTARVRYLVQCFGVKYEMENTARTEYENVVRDQGHRFIVFFLNDDEGYDVHVDEVKDVDLSEIMLHVNLGGSVFITHRRKPRTYQNNRKKSKRTQEELTLCAHLENHSKSR